MCGAFDNHNVVLGAMKNTFFYFKLEQVAGADVRGAHDVAAHSRVGDRCVAQAVVREEVAHNSEALARARAEKHTRLCL